jgi:hypothetical protein
MTEVEVKEAVRTRDGNACAECGMTNEQHNRTFGRSLEVHRNTPGSPYTVGDCSLLCQPCHRPKPVSARGRGRRATATKKTKLVTLTMPTDWYVRARSAARDLSISVPDLMRMATADYLQRRERAEAERASRPKR